MLANEDTVFGILHLNTLKIKVFDRSKNIGSNIGNACNFGCEHNRHSSRSSVAIVGLWQRIYTKERIAIRRDINIIGNGPQALADIVAVGNDLKIDNGTWTCGKEQSVPVSCGMPTVLIDGLIVGGE